MLTVSVIMCVYNPKWEELISAVNSILTQIFVDFELVICDDASTNNTYSVLSEWSRKDSRIRLIRNDRNVGAGAARNRCIAISTGTYVAIMDADDYSAPDRLERQVRFLERNTSFDFVGTGAMMFNDDGVWGQRQYVECPQKREFLFVLPFIHASIMFRKSALERVNGYRTAVDAIRAEDYDLLMRLYAIGSRGANLPEVLYFVREDSAAYKRRKYRYRINEVLVRYKGFKALGLMPLGYFFVIKPLIVGAMPYVLLNRLKKLYYKKSFRVVSGGKQ